MQVCFVTARQTISHETRRHTKQHQSLDTRARGIVQSNRLLHYNRT